MPVLSTTILLFLSLALQGSIVLCRRPVFLSETLSLCDKTPPTFQTDFLQSCKLYLTTETCTDAWTAFLNAFVGKNASAVQPGDYNGYFSVIPIKTPLADQSLFWSGTYTLVDVLSMMNTMGVNVVSSTNSLSSLIVTLAANSVSNVYWCSNEGLDTLDFENPCSCSITIDFWSQFSTLFAQKAIGTTFFLVDGERMPIAFNTSSFYSRFELPNLDTNVVTRVVVMDVHRQGNGMACGQETLVTLQNQVTNRNLKYDCYDIYGRVDQTENVAKCVRDVVDRVQMGNDTSVRHIMCNGTNFFQASMALILLVLLVSIGLV